MSPVVMFIILILGVGISFLIVFIIRSTLEPKKISGVINLVKQGKNAQAAKIAKAIVAKEPRNGLAHYWLGVAYQNDGKGEVALMEFKTVNQISQFGPNLKEIDFRKKMADLFAKFNQPEEALKEYLLLTKLEPSGAENFYNSGLLFERRGRSDMATQYLRKAIELDPRSGPSHYLLGTILYREKKSVEAKSEFEFALKYESGNADAFFFLGKIQKENHDFTAALVAFEKAERSPELKVKALVERGGCYMSLNDMDRAIPELERAVKMSKDEGSNETLYARYFLSMCYEKLRKLDLAIVQWEKIYLKKPSFKDVSEKLSNYQEFRTDDTMKDYIASSKEEFLEICQSIITTSMMLAIRDVAEAADTIDIVAVEGDSGKWLGAKKIPKLVRFLRLPDVLEDSVIRKLLEDMKRLNIIRGAIITSSGFTRTAIDFAENRPVELFNKDKLQELLDKCSFFKSPQK